MRFLDNVLQGFIDNAGTDFARATYAMRERSVGLGVMGFHLPAGQQRPARIGDGQGVEQEDVQAHPRPVRRGLQVARQGRGACPDAADFGFEERFSNKLAIAPTASISIICGGASPGIEPSAANVYNHKTLSGSFVVRNPYLEKMLEQKGKNDEDTWTSITVSEGSVQHLDCLDDHEKAVFKTAFEIDQRWLVEHGADRAPFICQSQSLNLFLPADVHKRDLHQIHDGVEARREEPLLLPLALDPARARRWPARRHGRRSATKPFQPPESTRSLTGAAGPAGGTATIDRLRRCLSCQ